MKLNTTFAGFAILASFTAASAHAYSVDFSCITQNSATNCAIGESQLVIDVSDLGNQQVQFLLSNNGTEAGAVEGIYFDDGSLLGISSLIDKDEGVGGHSGVDFTAGSASPPNLPSANSIFPAFETTAGFLADSDPSVSKNAVGKDEWLAVIFDLQAGRTFDDVLLELQNGDLRIGLHMIAFDNGGSESFVNVAPVPLPASWLLFASGLWVARKLGGRTKA